MRCLLRHFLILSLFSLCFCEINVKNNNLVSGFINYMNSLPNQPFVYEEGFLNSAQQTEKNIYNIETTVRVSEVHNIDIRRLLHCTATVVDLGDEGIAIPNGNHVCTLILDEPTEQPTSTASPVVEDVERGPVELYNEIQPSNVPSSGEQFVAVRRENGVPCIGCSVHVDPQAAGVTQLAQLAIRHLDRHQPEVRHSLNTVLDVERQVQIVNGVRYILTLKVDYNNCSLDDSESCASTTTCKISILEKPWVKLPKGRKYRTVLSNNCTEEWIFFDNGEEISDEKNEGNDPMDATATTQITTIRPENTSPEFIEPVKNTDLHANQQHEHILSDTELKDLQDQIIPYHELNRYYSKPNANDQFTQPTPQIQRAHKLQSSTHFRDTSMPSYHTNQPTNSESFSEDKKKIIDEMINFFDFDISRNIDSPRRKKRFVKNLLGGRKERNPSNLTYKNLAEESLRKYLQSSGIERYHKVIAVKNVTTQVVAGLITRINFTASPTNCDTSNDVYLSNCVVQNSADLLECETKIYERAWENIKNIDVECSMYSKISKTKRQVNVGVDNKPHYKPLLSDKSDEIEDSIFKKFAEQSLIKHLRNHGINRYYKITSINNNSTKDLPVGTILMLDFTIMPTNCHIDRQGKRIGENCKVLPSFPISCHSEVYGKKWINRIHININCNYTDITMNDTSSLEIEVDSNSPEHFRLAEECMRRYMFTYGIRQHYKVVTIKLITKQPLIDLWEFKRIPPQLTKIFYSALPTNCRIHWEGRPRKGLNCEIQYLGDSLDCYSRIVQLDPPSKKAVYKTDCSLNHKITSTPNPLTLVEAEQNADSPEFTLLAQQSIEKYMEICNITVLYKAVSVERVRKIKPYRGMVTKIDFTIRQTNCTFSLKKEQPKTTPKPTPRTTPESSAETSTASLLNEDLINAFFLQNRTRDPDPEPQPVHCEFLFHAPPVKCYSEVWHSESYQTKAFKVNCTSMGEENLNQSKAEKLEDPKSPQSIALAEESLGKFFKYYGVTQLYKVISVDRVATVTGYYVDGKATLIEFKALPTNCEVNSTETDCTLDESDEPVVCRSQIWNKVKWPTSNPRVLKINCTYKGDTAVARVKRHIPSAEIDVTSPVFKALAEESLKKYLQTNGATEHYKVIAVEHVEKPVVLGVVINIDFVALPTNCQVDSEGNPTANDCEVKTVVNGIKCHSEIWERLGLIKKVIEVNCFYKKLGQAQTLTGSKEKDFTSKDTKAIAQEALLKYLQTNRINQHHTVITVQQFAKQTVGAKTMINTDFKALPTNCVLDKNGDSSSTDCEIKTNTIPIECHCEIFERSWINRKYFNVNCSYSRLTKEFLSALEVVEDENSRKSEILAVECMRRFLYTYQIGQDFKVVAVKRVSSLPYLFEYIFKQLPGVLTKIDFNALPTNCDVDDEARPLGTKCEVEVSAYPIECHAEVIQRASALEYIGFKVNCSFPGEASTTTTVAPLDVGEKKENANCRQYKLLAQESINNFVLAHKIEYVFKVVSVDRVRKANVSQTGSLTKIDFSVKQTKCKIKQNTKTYISNCEIILDTYPINCYSEVWRSKLSDKKAYEVSCMQTINVRGNRIQKTTYPNSPAIYAIAEDSLTNFLKKNHATQHYKVIEINHVVTVTKHNGTGLVMVVDFKALPTNCWVDKKGKATATYCEFIRSSNDTLNCQVQVLETNSLDMTVHCVRFHAPFFFGSESEEDARSPEYKLLAEKSLEKYLKTNGITQHHKVITVERVVTQGVAGVLTKIDFKVLPTSCSVDNEGKPTATNCEVQESTDQIKCHSEVWERSWLNSTDITVNCAINDGSVSARSKRNLPGGEQEKDASSPEYKLLAEKSLEKYLKTNGITQYHKVITVERVVTQIVAGVLTKIDFKILPTTCQVDSEGKPTATNCKVQASTDQIKCHSEVWERSWLNSTDITVSCALNDESVSARSKRGLPGGEQEKDASSPEYKLLAEKSLEKYLKTNGITQYHIVITVERVVTQVVAGILTKIDFKVLPTTCQVDNEGKPTATNCEVQASTDQIKCHSEVWERSWLNSTDITVSCALNDESGSARSKRGLPGGEQEKDASSPEYKLLAEKSLEKYLKTNGITQYHKVITVERVVTQVVAGVLTKIDFKVLPTTCQVDNEGKPTATNCEVQASSDQIQCHSEVWKRSWLNSTDIVVNCALNDESVSARSKRGLPGGEQEKDASSPEYKLLAEKSLEKYLKTNGITQYHKVITVERVVTQVVAGILTKIDFKVLPTTCQVDNEGKPTATNCEVQASTDQIKCHSEVWERSWLNSTDITVNCALNDESVSSRFKRGLPGGEHEKDASSPEYKLLAEKSLEKYLKTNGITQYHKVFTVERVVTQVVAGVLTKIDFKVLPTTCQVDSEGKPTATNCKVQASTDQIKCHSEVWVRSWLNSTDITVSCALNDESVSARSKRGLPGGEQEKDASSPEYKLLAEKSLEKYLKTNGITQYHKVITVERVVTQVVAGILTKIDFKVLPTTCQVDNEGKPTATNCEVQASADQIKCHSEVWERSWLNSTDITVNCAINDGSVSARSKRNLPGGEQEKDASSPEYKLLAKKSLEKYLKTNGITQYHKVITVERVVSQVVAGVLTKIDFKVLPTTCHVDNEGEPTATNCEVQASTDQIKCHSEVWERSWLNSTDITVSCALNDESVSARSKRGLPGGEQEKDASSPEYKLLAEKSLEKYLKTNGITQYHKVITVERVVTQVVAGVLTKIDFKVLPTTCQVDNEGKPTATNCEVQASSDQIQCHSEVWKRSWLNSMDIVVNCALNDESVSARSKRGLPDSETEEDISSSEYQALAEASLKKYLKTNGITQQHVVVKVERVRKEIINGVLTMIDFKMLPTNCQLNDKGKPSTTNCTVLSSASPVECHSDVWERAWSRKHAIKVDCSQKQLSAKLNAISREEDVFSPKYKALAKQSLQKYLLSNNITEYYEVVAVKRVRRHASAGIVNIDFRILPTNCEYDNDGKLTASLRYCKVDKGADEIECHTEIRELFWLSVKTIEVNCYKTESWDEQIFNSEQNQALAQECLQNFLLHYGIRQYHVVSKVLQVSKQTIGGALTNAGTLIKVDFNILPTNCEINSEGQPTGNKCVVETTPDEALCHSEMWERVLGKRKSIKTDCFYTHLTSGGWTKEDALDPKYKTLAIESLMKYLLTHGIKQHHKVMFVRRVYSKLYTGTITKIFFEVLPTACEIDNEGNPTAPKCSIDDDKKIIDCHSEIWQRDVKKAIKVNCFFKRLTRFPAVKNKENVALPKYQKFAEESLKKFLKYHGSSRHYIVKNVQSAYTIVGDDVYGTTTLIDFTALPTNCETDEEGEPTASDCKVETSVIGITCHSELWGTISEISNPLTIKCTNNGDTVIARVRRQIPGSQIEKDATLPEYKALADESLQKYLETNGITRKHKVVAVEQVRKETFAGLLTTIDFTILPADCQVDNKSKTTHTNYEIQTAHGEIRCHSKIWERAWIQKKEITVNCTPTYDRTRNKRYMVIGEINTDETRSKYEYLAKESLKKYLRNAGIRQFFEVVEIEFVEKYLHEGSVTKIDFKVSPTNCKIDKYSNPTSPNCKILNIADKFSCHTEIWEEKWQNKKNIKVNCRLSHKKINKLSLRRDGSEGGEPTQERQEINGAELETEEKAEYMSLARESLRLFLMRSGIIENLKVVDIVRIIIQNDTGILTKIEFQVQPTTCQVDNNGLPISEICDSYEEFFTCYSDIFELPHLKQKETRVNCELPQEQDTTATMYKNLAEESLQIHLQRLGVTQQLAVLSIDNVVTQTDPGLLIKIDFTVVPTACYMPPFENCDISNPSETFSCNSEIFHQPWMRMNDVTVSCNIDDFFNQDVIDMNSLNYYPVYVNLAAESMKKYLNTAGIRNQYKIDSINEVSTMNLEGILWRIDFTISPFECYNAQRCDLSKVMRCMSEVWGQDSAVNNIMNVECTVLAEITNTFNAQDFMNSSMRNQSLIRTHRSSKGGFKKLDPKGLESLLLAMNSLQKYKENDIQISQKCTTSYVVEGVNWITKPLISETIYKIGFTATKTVCCPNNLSQIICNPITLYCHSEKYKRYKVNCWGKNDKERIKVESRTKRDVLRPNPGSVAAVDVNSQKIKNKAEIALKKFEESSRLEYGLKIKKIHRAQEQVVTGLITSIEFSVSQTKCLVAETRDEINNCELRQPYIEMRCNAILKELPSFLGGLSTMVNCRNVSNRREHRKKREMEVTSGSFTAVDVNSKKIKNKAETAVKKFEKRTRQENGFKVIQIHQAQEKVVAGIITSIEFTISQTKCLANDTRAIINSCELKEPKIEMRCNAVFKDLVLRLGGSTSIVNCMLTHRRQRQKRETNYVKNTEISNVKEKVVQGMVGDAIKILEAGSIFTHKQKVVLVKNHYFNITKERVTTIDFVVGYTNCSKYEIVKNIEDCGLLEIPRRNCVATVFEKLWTSNNRQVTVQCDDQNDGINIDPVLLANEGLKRIEAKYPHPRQQKVVRIVSLEKQLTAGLHYRLKIEVGLTNCTALSLENNCVLDNNFHTNKFCRVNIWLELHSDYSAKVHVMCEGEDEKASALFRQIQAQYLFNHFIATYSPAYVNDRDEMNRRFKTFENNVRKIHELNANERGTARYAVTKFADLTEDEFSTRYLGLKPSLRLENQLPLRKANIPQIDLPESFDWRIQNAVTEVKNQGACGSCWAFSVTGNIEGQWKIKTGKLISLSEQELVDCDKMDKGCDGGLPDNAYRSIEELGGLETEADYPYEGENDKCNFNKTLARVKISGAVNISSDETEMAKWLVKNGPISIGINANAMQFYVAGISHPWKMLCNPKNLDHGVLIVGYGAKDYPLFKKHLPYWIIKNSWGKEWGEQGYYRVYRGDGTCGVNQMASSAVV